jgi:hypothetical protein
VADLASDDAARAYEVIRQLEVAPEVAVALFRAHLSPVSSVNAQQLARLIENLDSPEFSVRRTAAEELRNLRNLAEPALRKAVGGRPSLDARRLVEQLLATLTRARLYPSGDRLRLLRAIEVLESLRTAEARQLLADLARGASGAYQTEEAKAALKRLTEPAR